MRSEPAAKDGDEEPRGVRCPVCNCAHLPVHYTRKRRNNIIMRVRICRHCGKRITTYEKAGLPGEHAGSS